MKLSWNFVIILLCIFTGAFGANSPEIRLTSAITFSTASSTCAEETVIITSPYGVTGPDLNCSIDHDIDLLLDGDENTWWQSVTQDENVTLNFQFRDSFELSGVQLVFRSPLPQLVLVQIRLNGAIVTTLAYADDCQVYSESTCYPLRNIVDYEVNCSDISLCPRLVNLRHTLESQYYAIAEVTVYGYVPANRYFSSLHSIAVEAEHGAMVGSDEPLPLLTTIPQFSGNGYTNITTNESLEAFIWSIEIPRSSTYQMILRYGNTNDIFEAPLFTGLVTMFMNRNGDSNAYRFFIESCGIQAWCYSQAVGQTDTTTAASYQLEAGVWEIRALVNIQNLLLDVFIAIPAEFYNPVSLGISAADRFTNECGLSTNTLGRGTSSEDFCFQSAFILSYNFHPMLFECFCDPIGSVEQLCDPIGGQCPCILPVNGSTHPYGLNCDLCPSLSYGPTSAGCEECNCINNRQCNVSTGQCPCLPLVTGRQCSQCELNTFGDPAIGCSPCQCNEPGTILCNDTSGECVCEPFYDGVTCDVCTIDAFNDMVAGCQPCQCNSTGSTNQSCSSTGQCHCKPFVTGPKCTSCEPGAFYFTDSGCIECWCNGLTEIECNTSTGSYETVVARLNTTQGWSLAILNGDEVVVTTTGIYLESGNTVDTTTLTANISNINSSMPIYWNVPSYYVNMNWLFSYGANLVVETVQENGRTGSVYSAYGVYLMDGSTVLVHSVDPTVDINTITIALVEGSWLDVSTGRPVTRPVFMSVLAGLTGILLPAAPANTTASIIRLTLFQFGSVSSVGNYSIPVERCSCPVGHSGLSCQECVDGYFMSDKGMCISCQCNGRSTKCDSLTGECQNCQGNTTGFSCEECLPCYVNITSGSSFMCKACDCSLTGCRNCSIDEFSSEEQCTCLAGYDQEDQCRTCVDGYFQSPLSGECILSCGECVDKLVLMHNESMQDLTTVRNRLGTFYYDVHDIYQQLNNVTLRAIPLIDMIYDSFDVNQQLQDDLNMVDDCSTEVDNVTIQVNDLWEQAVQLHNQISTIPNLTTNAAEAMSLYQVVSTFNTTVLAVLSQLESLSVGANTILVNLTEIVAANMDSFADEINQLLQLLQNVNGAQTSASDIRRIARAHQGKLTNITTQLQTLLMKISSLDEQVNQLERGVAELQRLLIDIQQLRLMTMSSFSNVSNTYTSAINALQLAREEFTRAVNLEQYITTQLQVLLERLVNQEGGSGSGSDDNQGGEVVQELLGLQRAVQNSFAFLAAINNSQAVADASIHTNQLILNATTISSILVPALSLQPVEVVRNFSGLLASIKEATSKSVQANETVTETLQQVIMLMSGGLANHATQLYTLSQSLSSQVETLNASLGGTRAAVYQASEEADIFEELRNETAASVELALNQISRLQIASNTIQNQVNSDLDAANSSLQCVSMSLYPLQCEVDGGLHNILTVIDDTLLNSTSLLSGANNSLTDALATISDQAEVIPVIQDQSATNSELIEQLNVSVQALRQRMDTARTALASIAVALRLSGNQTYSYSLPMSADQESNEHTQLSLIFRTDGPNGTLLYTSNLMDQCTSLGVVNRQVVFSFALDTISATVNNPLSIQDNIWYQVLATRDADVGRLSVTQLQDTTTVTSYAVGTGSANTSAIPLMDEVYVGGTSSMMTGSCVSSEQFTGCVDTIVVNNEPLPLLLPNQGLDSVTPCGPRPPVEPTRSFDSSTWLLGGGSYLILTAGQQSSDTFRVMMGFRTSNPHGIFYFSGTSVVIFMMDGLVWYRISGVFSGCEVNTAQRYDDNTWHYLTALYSMGECSITVDDELVTVSASQLIIPPQDGSDYIGGAPMFDGRAPFVSFAGCLRDVIIGTVARNLSNNTGSERVNFNGCPINVTSGVRFNGEGYAQLQIATELINANLTNIVFTFKTIQVEGLLLELGRENKLILSLYHSHVRLEYYHTTGSVILESSSPGYNDNLWHTVSITSTENMITLMVDSVMAASYDQRYLPTIALPDQLTIGGSSTSNYLSRYRGCFRDLIINNLLHDFHNPITLVGVSLFGCYLPEDLPPTPTSTVVTMATTSMVPSVSSSDIPITTSIPTSVFSPVTTGDVVSTDLTVMTTTPVIPTTVPFVSPTVPSIVSETPTSIVSETASSIILETPTLIISETPTLTVSGTPTTIVSETATSIIPETPTSIVSETPVLETPTETSAIIVSMTSQSSIAVPSVSSMTPVYSTTPEMSITPTLMATPTETLIPTSTSIVSVLDTKLFTTPVISITSTSATMSSVVSIPTETSVVETISDETSSVISTTSSVPTVISSSITSTPVTPTVVVDTTLLTSSSMPIDTTDSMASSSMILTSSSLFISATDSTSILPTDISLIEPSVDRSTSTPASSIMRTSSTVVPPVTRTTTTEPPSVGVITSTEVSPSLPLGTPLIPSLPLTTVASTELGTPLIPSLPLTTVASTELGTPLIPSLPLTTVASTELGTPLGTPLIPSLPLTTVASTELGTPLGTPLIPSLPLTTVASTEIMPTPNPTTPVMLTSSVESLVETLTSTPASSPALSETLAPTETSVSAVITSIETSVSLATTTDIVTTTETPSQSLSISPTSAIITYTLPSPSILTMTTSIPTPTPVPLTLGLNGLGSFISLAPRSDIVNNYNIQLVFQTRSIEGILLYTESLENGDYIALYLRNGLIIYSFDLGGGAITVESSEQYSDGLSHNVTIVRTGHISLVTIDNGVEVIRAVGSSSFTQLNIGMNSFYVGGVSPLVVPTEILEPGEEVSTYDTVDNNYSLFSVEACISSLYINNQEIDLNVNMDSSGIVDCSEVLINEVVTFTGNNSYATLFESFSPVRDFQLTLSFRSSVENKLDCNGLLVYVGSSDFSDHLTLNLDSGSLLLSFNNGGGTTAVEYSRPDINFCDGNWYEVEVMKSGVIGHLIFNGTDSEMTSSAFSMFTTIDSTEPLFIGGIPSTIATAHNVAFTPFRGCIRNLMLHLNGQIVPAFISRSAELVNVNLDICSF